MNLKNYSFCAVLYCSIFFGALAIFSSCGGTSSSSFTSSTTIKSSNLSVSVSALSQENSGSKAAIVKSAVTGLNEASNPCPIGTTTCYSPTAMGGKFASFNLILSTDGDQQRLEIISSTEGSGTDEDGDDIVSTDLNSFDLGSPTAISGTPSVSTGSFNDTTHYASLNWTIGWIDAQFDKEDFGLSAGTVTYRFVYFTDSVTGYQKGDVLIKDGSDFKWCIVGATSMSNCYTTRAAAAAAGTVLTQNSGIVNYAPTDGSPDLPYLDAGISANATGVGEVTVTASDLATAVSFTADFDHAYAFAIETPSANTTISDEFDVMDEIYVRGLSATPTGVSVSGGVNAVLTATPQ